MPGPEEKKPWEMNLNTEEKKPWEQDLVVDATEEKKNDSLSSSDGSTLGSTEQKSVSGPQSTSKSQTPSTKNENSMGFDFAKFKETFPEKNPTVKINVPEEEIMRNREKERKEFMKSAAVKKADQNIAEIDKQVVDVSRNLNSIVAGQDENMKQLQSLSDQINDPSTPEETRQQLIPIYNQTLDATKQTAETGKKVWDQAVALQRSKATLKKVYQVQEDLDQDLNDDALKVTGNFLTHVYNATLPAIIAGGGALIKSAGNVMYGDTLPGATMLTDAIGDGLMDAGHGIKGDTDARYDDKHYITSTAGDIVGSVISAAVPGGAVASAGKAATMIAGATSATMSMADDVYSKAADAGLSDRDAGMMTLAIAPISGLLEVWGAGNIIDNVAGKKMIQELISESTKKLAGQKITKELMYETVGNTFKEIGKKYSVNMGKSMLEEGGTELLQGEIEKAAENIYDKASGEEKYGTKFFSTEAQLDVAKQAAIGAIAGGAFGILSGVSKPKDIYSKAIELKNDPEKLSKFREMLDTEVKAGHIDSEQADNIRNNINAMMAADSKIPPEITDKDKRFKAVELIKEKTALEDEIKDMDKALTTEKRDRIKEINSALEVIATGKEPVKMERRKFSKEKPAFKKSEESTVPLTAEEQIELKALEKDNSRIGLEGEELSRYNELKARSNDKTNIEGVPSDERKGKTAQQKEPIIAASEEKAKTSGILQTSVPATKEEFIASQKEKLKEDDSYSEILDQDGTYDRIFGNKYEISKIREERTQQNEEESVKEIPEDQYETLKTEFDEQTEPELRESEPRISAITSEAESAEESIRAASNEGKALPEAEIERLETEQKELLKDIDHVLTTPSRRKKASRVSKVLSEPPTSVREAALHYFLGGGKVRKSDVERIMGGNFSKEDWGKNNKTFDDKATAIDKIAMENIAELMGRELTADEQTQVMEEIGDIALNLQGNKNKMLDEAKSYRQQAKEVEEKQQMDAHTAAKRESKGKKKTIETETIEDETAPIAEYEGEVPFQKVMKSDKYNRSQKRIAKSITNVVSALKDISPDLKVVLHDTTDSFEKAAYEANKKAGMSEARAKKDVSGNAFYLDQDNAIHINLPLAQSNTLFHEGTHPILNMIESLRPGTVDALFNDLVQIEKKIGQEGYYTEEFASAYSKASQKMEAITEFIADVADGKIQVNESNRAKIKRFFARILNALGIKIKDLNEENIVSLAKKIQKGFETGEAIDIETNRSLRDQLGVQFQAPYNTDGIPEEDIQWALKTLKKLGNDFEKFREKLSKTEEGRDLLSKNLFGAMLEYNSAKPQASTIDRLKSLTDNLKKSSIPQALKDKIDEHGLRSDVFHHEEAKQIADQAIKLLGIDGAVDLADRRLKGSVKAFVYGAGIDYYAKKEAEATSPKEKDAYAQRGADIAEQFQKDAEDYGRFISAIGEYYKSSPLIIQKTETNKLRTQAKAALDRMKNTVNKVKSAEKEFAKVTKKTPPRKEGTPRRTLSKSANRESRRTELLQKWDSLKPGGQKQVIGYTQEQTDIMTEIGAIHVADGAWTFQTWYKRMKEDLGISEKTAREVWEKEKMPSDLDAEQRTLSQMVKEDLGDTEEYKRQQEQILNKYFPKKKLENDTVRKELHEKIIEQYNAGVFGEGKNPDGEDFQKLFFEKLGIVNPDAADVQAKIGEFAEKIAKAPEGSIMQREAQEDLLTYIAQIAYRTRLSAGASKLSSIWYANILSSPATHLRNIQYNVITTALSQPFLLAQKAIIGKDYKAIPGQMKAMIEGFKKGMTESGRILTTGRSSRFDKVGAKSELERGSKYIKPFVLPGRGLKASDIFFTDAAYNLKLQELARQFVKKQNPGYSEEQINASVNELLGNTAERKEAARTQAEKEMADFYGDDWKTKPGLNSVFKIRQFEIMEQSIPSEMKKEATKWSKKALLTNRPTGALGVLADKINGLNEKLYFTKFVMPFVNVPFNLVNAMVERSPLGLIKAIRKAEGWGSFQEELSDNEVKELYIKIANYAVATAVLAMMNGDDDDDPLVITGAQTGDYMDNKGVIRGGGLEPYSVYVNGKKIMSYKTSPWAAALLVPGYIRDAKLYAKANNLKDIAAYSGLNWLLFINDQSAMQGVQGLVSTLAEAKKTTSETVTTTLAKYAQNMIVPYSGAVKFLNNNVKSILGMEDNRPIDSWEYLTKDIPFVDQVSRTRKDHFGQPVKESFDIPLVPIGQRGVVEAMGDVSEYYRMTKEKGYYPSFTTQRRIYVDGQEIQMSKKDLDDINTDRGQLVAQALDSKNVFVPRDSADENEELADMTTMEYLKTLDNDEFKKRMDALFSEATKIARIRKYGEKVGITAKDADKARKKAEEMGYEEESPKIEANKRLTEEYQDKGTMEIAIDSY